MSVLIKLFGLYRLLLGEELHLDISQYETLSSILNIIDAKIKDIPSLIVIINNEGILLCSITIYRPTSASELETGDSITIKLTDLPDVKTSAGLLVSTSRKKSERKTIKRFFPKKAYQPVVNSIT